MRFLPLIVPCLALLATTVFAWEKEDHEIFDLVASLEAAEGKGSTFYTWLNVPPTATTNEISKAYRKMSIQLHPDKNPGVKGAHERFARLGVIAKILREKESRQRYDFFHKNGIPTWRGTGYYYSRFRPGLGSVVVFLTVLTSSLQFVVQRMNYKRDLNRVEFIVSRAKAAAWGSKMTPPIGQRKVKVALGDAHDEDGNYAGSKTVEMVVDGEKVFLLDPSGDMHPVDSSTAIRPTFSNTWFLALLKAGFHKVTSKKDGFTDMPGLEPSSQPKPASQPKAPDVDSDEDSSTTGSEAHASRSSTPGRAMPTSKAGGMRRKAIRKRN